jgi:hypothetical protein
LFADIHLLQSRVPPAVFDVYMRKIMDGLATRQAPVSAVCGAVAATPVEPSADEDQVLYALLLL